MELPLAASTLQLFDRWIGIPACFVLSLAAKLQRLVRGRPARKEPGKILFVKFAEQGSTILASSAIHRAARMVGRENIYFVVFKENRFILDVMGVIPEENVIIIEHNGILDMARSAFAALRTIHRLGIDAAVDLEFFSRSSAALTFLSGATHRVGFHTFFGEGPYRGNLMTHRLLYNPYLHTSQIFELMVSALQQDPALLPTFGVPPPLLNEELSGFSPRPGELDEVKTILQEASGAFGDIRLILLNPNASDLLPLRRWQPENYTELARRLLAAYPEIYIAMTGNPGEEVSISGIAARVGSERCFSMAGKTTLRQLLVLYCLSEVLVTNDSGPAHFAALTPISVVTLFGPETPSLFGSLNLRNTAIWKGISCSPCVNAYNNRQSPCRNNLCMQQITVDEVFAAVTNAIGSRSKTAPRP